MNEDKEEVKSILESGGFESVKLAYNNPNIIKEDCLDSKLNDYFGNEEIKTLGLIWNPKENILKYQVQPLAQLLIENKRTILFAIS